jgi:ribosomal protein S18 acetylase RimI-like enzyme
MKSNISIIRATAQDSQLLAGMGRITFLEAHGNSASADIVTAYVDQNYSETVLTTQLTDPGNLYHLIYCSGAPAGYSKIIYNTTHANISATQVTKLERLYLLKDFYGLGLGLELLNYNIELSKKMNQAGMWLFVWKENHRAINFYYKTGFKIIGSHDFKLSEAHSNPNHLMFLNY